MALPKEPRQKMINMMYLVLTALLALNVSAEILNAFKIVDKSLVGSTMRLAESNNRMYESLDAKLADKEFAERARIWQPIAGKAGAISGDLYNMLEQFKGNLRLEADARTASDTVFKEDNLDAASRLFNTGNKGEELFRALASYKKQVLDLHPELRIQFDKNFPLEVSGSARDWLYKNFNMVPTVAALTILSKLQNDVRNAENQVVTFCHNQLSRAIYLPDSYGAIVSQNSDYFMPGGTIKIQGSVGAYSKGSGTKVLINGVPAPLDASGVAQLEMPAGGTGMHSADVIISYLTQDGKQQTETRKINWTVGAPGAAAVMADKLNLLYIGVPNPITVAAGVGEEKVSVSTSQGTIVKRATGKYDVDGLTREGDITITVSADGKLTTFPFRVKLLPPPTAYVGVVKEGNMPSASFRAMKGVRAELADAPINAPYIVVSYELSAYGGPLLPQLATAPNTGPFWSGRAFDIAEKVRAGTIVNISKIMVKGPDGKVRPASNSIVIRCT